ncbi:Vacuolar amino acid transporter 3 [Ceratocystis platani]|uniref:Vacuolar amino acid transporter 3 n=1 Tax=Ceratocystis fimbriata f. sp. platani TaxID=88771 RepID=A0A0F8D944_CERFI|nr:Vacuolar amino acid transporter 3 [Ceratocystis platani]
MTSPSSRLGTSPSAAALPDQNRLENAALLSSSVPRADATARLASPIPFAAPGTPPRQSGLANEVQRSGSATPLVGSIGGPSSVGPGISALAAALSGPAGASPPRFGTPPIRSATPPLQSNSPFVQGQMSNYGSFDSRPRGLSGTGVYEDPEIVRRHLVQPTDAVSETSSRDGGKGKSAVEDEQEFSSLRLQGGDVTRPIYKWAEEAEAKQRMQRSKSFNALRPDPVAAELDINTIKVPGGFRRNFVRRAGGPSTTADSADGGEAGDGLSPNQPKLLTSSFLEFLTIYGHFAGEELEEDDEALRPGEYFSSGAEDDAFDGSYDGSESEDEERMEDSALLTPSRRKRRRKSRGGSGNNSTTGAALLLLKSFVGTGVLFLPRAYLNGGMLFSNVVLLLVAALSYYCFVLLVTTRLKIVGSFGDIGGILYGKWMRNIILASVVLSQIGFVAAYIVFTSENLQAFILAVTDCKTHIDISWLIIMQMVIFLPFSLLRDIGKLGFTALIADAFILVGLAYLFYYDILTLSTKGLADIVQFNEKDWTLFIGTAIFTFEGIGLIIPIQESMKQPSKFPKVMFVVMVIITVLFTTMGAFSYAAYGSKTETVVLLNLPQESRMVNTVQLLYSAAILLSTPLQIFPAIRITENSLFTKSGKYNPYIKWQKNVFRFFLVALCALIAYCGADNLDKFVALVGNFACIPLVYIYPFQRLRATVTDESMAPVEDILEPLASFSLTHVYYDPNDPISHLCAFLALVPHALLVAYGTLVISTREAEVALMLIGQLACEAANFVLKRIIKEERPNQHFGKGYGMPSSHAQFVAFWSVTIALFMLVRHRAPGTASRATEGPQGANAHKTGDRMAANSHVPNRLIPISERLFATVGAFSLAAAVASSRIYLGYHSKSQVLAGAITGVTCALGWFFVTSMARQMGLLAWALELPLIRWLRVRDLLLEEDPAAAGWEAWGARRASVAAKAQKKGQ